MRGMRIARIELRDVGPFDDAVLEIPEPTGEGEVVLFEGPNGSGKTTIAQAIAVAVASPVNAPRALFEAPSDLLRRRMRGDASRLAVTLEDQGTSLQIVLPHWPEAIEAIRAAPPLVERLAMLHGAAESELSNKPPLSTSWAAFAFKGPATTAEVSAKGPRELRDSPLRGALSFSDKERLPTTSLGQFLTNIEFDRVQAKLYASERPEGDDARDLELRAQSRQATLDRVENALSRVLDRRVDIDFPIGQRAPRILFDGAEIPIDLLGEGLRSTVSWLSDLVVRLERVPWASPDLSPFEQEFWLILDEIEESLHPTMQARLLPALRGLFPKARIYATTHSPFVVASLGEGHVFSIRPDPRTHRVSGPIKATALEHGRSLEWVVSAIFEAPSGFVDDETRERLEAHLAGVTALRRGATMDWDAFLGARAWLLELNEEVRAVVASREVPVRGQIAAKIREHAA